MILAASFFPPPGRDEKSGDPGPFSLYSEILEGELGAEHGAAPAGADLVPASAAGGADDPGPPRTEPGAVAPAALGGDIPAPSAPGPPAIQHRPRPLFQGPQALRPPARSISAVSAFRGTPAPGILQAGDLSDLTWALAVTCSHLVPLEL